MIDNFSSLEKQFSDLMGTYALIIMLHRLLNWLQKIVCTKVVTLLLFVVNFQFQSFN